MFTWLLVPIIQASGQGLADPQSIEYICLLFRYKYGLMAIGTNDTTLFLFELQQHSKDPGTIKPAIHMKFLIEDGKRVREGGYEIMIWALE